MDRLQDRLLLEIAALKERRSQMALALKRVDECISKLAILADGEDDPELLPLLARVLVGTETVSPPVEPLIEVPPPPPAPPPTKRVRVTHDIVYACTQTFDGLFTVNDVTDLMADNEGVTDPGEKIRLRSAVASMLTKLASAGRVIHVTVGAGKRMGTFRKVVTTDHRRLPAWKNGAPTDIEVAGGSHQ